MNNKIYIAGRVSGIKYETAKKNFSKYERYWSSGGYEVVNPIELKPEEVELIPDVKEDNFPKINWEQRRYELAKAAIYERCKYYNKWCEV